MTLQIKRIIPPDDPNMRAYFTRTELAICPEAAERGVPTDNPILQYVLEIPGVVYAKVASYNITCVKAPTFEWDEIEPTMLRLLTSLDLGDRGQLLK